MPKYRYKGVVIEAATPESAKLLVINRLAGGEVDPTEGMGTSERFLAGIGSGMMNVGRQVGSMTGLVDDESIRRQAEIDAPLLETTAGSVGRTTGEIAAVAPLGVGAGAMAARALPAGAGVLARALPMATEGLTEGAVLAGPGERGMGAVTGAGFGGGLSMAGRLGGRLVRGARGSENAQRLLREGVDLTPGQMNRGGLMDTLEEGFSGKLTGVVPRAREAAQHQTFKAAARRALPPGMKDIAGESSEQIVDSLRAGFRRAYDAVDDIPISRTMGRQSIDDVAQGIIARAPGLGDDAIKELSWLRGELSKLPRGAAIKAQSLIKMRSNIRTRVGEMIRKGDLDRARALVQVEDMLTAKLAKDLPGASGQLLRNTDKQYGAYKVVEEAAYRAGDSPVVTPFQMSQAVKRGAGSKGLYASGGGRMRDLSRAGREAFATGTPPTGMALGGTMAAAAVGGALGGPAGMLAGTALPSSVAALMAGTRTGRRAYRGATGGQRLLRKALEAYKGEAINPLLRAGTLSELYRED